MISVSHPPPAPQEKVVIHGKLFVRVGEAYRVKFMKQCPLIDLAKHFGRLKYAGRHCRLCCSAVQGAPFQGANLLVGAVNCGSWRCELWQLAL